MPMLYTATASEVAELLSKIARCAAERDTAIEDANRARAERDGWAAKYDSLVREILHSRPQQTFQPLPGFDPCAGCGPVCGNLACPKRLVISYAPAAGTCAPNQVQN